VSLLFSVTYAGLDKHTSLLHNLSNVCTLQICDGLSYRLLYYNHYRLVMNVKRADYDNIVSLFFFFVTHAGLDKHFSLLHNLSNFRALQIHNAYSTGLKMDPQLMPGIFSIG